ncbi:unnamed protein product [Bemisia tabaci]|uniref:C2H2-type domain-containing protein n=1 Tax=Bemisia tabaci TaxID=7038 RepID=A0A9P0AI72_BEMTA|nr:unnamed protein product [Bemisia tabaci]
MRTVDTSAFCPSVQTTQDLPKLRLVPKSELMALKRNEVHNDHHFLMGNVSEDGELDKDNNNDSSNCLDMSGESSEKALALTSESGNCFSEPPLPRPPIRRRVRRRAASSNDPAEQLTEMSVRGLNLFRYASVADGVYKCTECAKSDILKTFKNKYSFQRHAFLYHEGCHRKVFPCPVCSKQFSRPDKMKNHMKTVHECYVPKDILFPNVPFFMPPPPSSLSGSDIKFTQEMKFPSDEIITHH